MNMKKEIIISRIEQLRQEMKKNQIDAYMIPTADFHNSEYVHPFFKVREYLSGFTGSNGTLVVMKEFAGLWTDGRYYVQAELELEGTDIELFTMQDENVPTIVEFLKKKLISGTTLGFDGRVLDTFQGLQLEKELGNEIRISYEKDLASGFWVDRPSLPHGAITILSEVYTGQSTADKLEAIRSDMKTQNADGLFISKLDEIMWLYNIRGCDVVCNPVALSYTYITKSEAYLLLKKEGINEEIKDYCEKNNISLRFYDDINTFIQMEINEKEIWMDYTQSNYFLYKVISRRSEIINLSSPVSIRKAIKNNIEITCMKDVYLNDSVAVTKFIFWLKSKVGKVSLTEVEAGKYLDALRKNIPGFVDFSFPTICAYKENAAMMHYEAGVNGNMEIEESGMLLVDSGGQYLGGTTDVTRTIVLGDISEEVKKHFTLVVNGMLDLLNVKFLHGCTGRNLDIMARQGLWQAGIDYKCGTGHGVGAMLNVHEGPHGIRWKYQKQVDEIMFEEGMVVTNEPGVYEEGSYGIRIENVMVCKKGIQNQYGQFMEFENVTFVPIDVDGVNPELMSEKQKKQLLVYQQSVFEKLVDFLTEEEALWLEEQVKKTTLLF